MDKTTIIYETRLYDDIDKHELLLILFGHRHTENYYEDWITNKMKDFKTFYNHLSKNHKNHYKILNMQYNKLMEKIEKL